MANIGIVTNGVRNNEFGGSHIYLSQLSRRLSSNGWNVTFFSYDSAFRVYPESEDFVSLGKLFGTPKQLISINRMILQLEEQFQGLDVIHTDWWLAGPALRQIASKHRIRYIIDSRNSLFDVNRVQNVYKWLILKALHPDHVIFVDHTSHKLHQQKFKQRSSRQIPVPIDTELFQPRRDILDSASRPFRLLFASWLRREKGLLDFFSAIEIVWQTHPNVEVLIAGEGNLRPQVEARAADDNRVTYLGRMSNREMPDVFAKVDLLVYPSYFEGFPRAILEGYACGVPTVATEVGGLALLREKNIGLIIQPGQIDELAQSICRMIDEPIARRKFSTDGQIFVLQEHSWPVVFEKIVQLYS